MKVVALVTLLFATESIATTCSRGALNTNVGAEVNSQLKAAIESKIARPMDDTELVSVMKVWKDGKRFDMILVELEGIDLYFRMERGRRLFGSTREKFEDFQRNCRDKSL
ncbi:hypothetical protein Q1695_015304 [Nippostrongylus brasiliensis]|nr:hypothetical protein Q1695_015304 [Nippostrongylus brasiliensis]